MAYPKAPSGSYKTPLINGLRLIGRTIEADEIEHGNIKLGIRSTFTGNIKAFPELSPLFVKALQALPLDDINGYYIEVLSNDSVVPACTNNVYVYNPDDKNAVAHVQKQLDNENFVVGELYLKS